MDTNKIRKRWQSQEQHKDTTLDYAISEIYNLCTEIEQLQIELVNYKATMNCIRQVFDKL